MHTRPRPRSIRTCLAVLFVGLTLHSPAIAQSPKTQSDTFQSDTGQIKISPVKQMGVVIETPGGVIYSDPTGGGTSYRGHPKPDLILISHEHHEHYDPNTLEELVIVGTRIVVPPFVMDQLPPRLKNRAVAVENGRQTDLGPVEIEAVPAYGLTGESAKWHPKGRGNGYVVSVDGRRLYIAGSSDATPEMRQLNDIDLAFLPLYPPYALGINDAFEAISSFKPKVAYIYQYNSTRTRDLFVEKMRNSSIATTVIARDIGCGTNSLLCIE